MRVLFGESFEPKGPIRRVKKVRISDYLDSRKVSVVAPDRLNSLIFGYARCLIAIQVSNDNSPLGAAEINIDAELISIGNLQNWALLIKGSQIIQALASGLVNIVCDDVMISISPDKRTPGAFKFDNFDASICAQEWIVVLVQQCEVSPRSDADILAAKDPVIVSDRLMHHSFGCAASRS